ncbi:hypothetical protein [Staphylococcus xylosus]|uniref:hypothetical protein n=1 Tax=Staphylococcus xylosus TaxID=1288 RepID=UPI003F57DA27
MIGSSILFITTAILLVILLGVLIYGTVRLFKNDDYLGGMLCVATIIFVVGSLTGWTLIVLGI